MLTDHVDDMSHQVCVLDEELEDLFISIAVNEEIIENEANTLDEFDSVVESLHAASDCLHDRLQIFLRHLFRSCNQMLHSRAIDLEQLA